MRGAGLGGGEIHRDLACAADFDKQADVPAGIRHCGADTRENLYSG